MPYGNGRQGMASGLQPTSARSYISLHHGLGLRDPQLWGLETHFCQWRSPRNSLGCGGTRTSHLRSTSVCWKHSARMLSTSSEWSLTWNGEGTETHSWCCTVPLFVPMDYGCIVYGTASNTNLRKLDSIHNTGLRLALGAFCTSPVPCLYTGQRSSFGGTSVKAAQALLCENSCLHRQSGTSCPAWIRPNH